MNNNICQLRLDFDALDITEVSAASATVGECTDKLTITGPTGRNPPVVCGTLSESHSKYRHSQSTKLHKRAVKLISASF